MSSILTPARPVSGLGRVPCASKVLAVECSRDRLGQISTPGSDWIIKSSSPRGGSIISVQFRLGTFALSALSQGDNRLNMHFLDCSFAHRLSIKCRVVPCVPKSALPSVTEHSGPRMMWDRKAAPPRQRATRSPSKYPPVRGPSTGKPGITWSLRPRYTTHDGRDHTSPQ